MGIEELFELKRKDSNVIAAMKIHAGKFRDLISKEDRENIALIALWKTLKRFGDREDMIPFLCLRIRWLCIAFLKSQNVGKMQCLNVFDNFASKSSDVAGDILDCLTGRDRQLVYKRYIEGKTLAEIAKEEEYSIEYINILLKKAIQKLRKSV